MKSTIRISNNGNTIRVTGNAANEFFKALSGQSKELARHVHVNNGVNDACKECGKDLRDEIHLRWSETSSNPPPKDIIKP